ncbi:3-methylcrotonyl-CoA carboxylase subunit alpha [Polymorphobacter glacialis]|uniref:3-methylcrotonyl-CoA carboxylase subunit alpha n=1 Tax=Sandarakinorhabdus glacialis TaxID=1614636 RepID=A0A916ZZH1_9SPHN|nr:biotin carboxylase N-terminal domain-containing protein [Polymorphobacter glacialis]GGE20123.1 3-methylcrotonyl-CoA carboxylase subunit alpha [Polymorphobacter glacialis]
MIKKLLIANRGEIACRIIRTARAMGIATVAIYSDADAQALHVSHADEAIHIGASPARESYLVPGKILAAAAASGADAIHPGYGFLSENAGFAQAVIDAGLVWVGPKPASIIAMGLKDAAKRLMQAAGVPTTPGYLGDDQSPARLQAEADAIGYPVLIKAVAGGGGKGMRRVENAADFGDALESCRREAAASFGEDRVLIEKYILSPRHIEVQVFGDLHGNVVHLFERDCSLQRRHQKVIEEAPAPGMDAATRAALCATAVQAARAVDYVGAGTIEFIADASDGLRADRIWFMEMNTRLQVEHPVTEAITGVDLVEWQLRVASGEALPRRQDELAIDGWAMEARLYAEDPATGFLPSIGKLEVFDVGTAWRIDTGVRQGDAISPFYDPMIAKVIAHGVDREAARSSLATTLGGMQIWPLRTNAGFLGMALAHPDFAGVRLDTGLIAREGDALLPPVQPSPMALAGAASALVRPGAINGFRLNACAVREGSFLLDGVPIRLPIGDQAGGQDQILIAEHGQMWALSRWRIVGGGGDAAANGAILSPMPGRIIAVFVGEGEAVTKGQKLLTLEAMKMEHTLVAPFDGIVVALAAVAGGQAVAGAALANIDRRES